MLLENLICRLKDEGPWLAGGLVAVARRRRILAFASFLKSGQEARLSAVETRAVFTGNTFFVYGTFFLRG